MLGWLLPIDFLRSLTAPLELFDQPTKRLAIVGYPAVSEWFHRKLLNW